MQPKRNHWLMIFLAVMLALGGGVGSVLAQGSGEQLCHPAGYCVQLPSRPGWFGIYDPTNNVLSATNATDGLTYALQLTYAIGMGNETMVSMALGILTSTLGVTSSDAIQATTLAGYPGALQHFGGSTQMGDGVIVVLFIGPDIVFMGAGASASGAWSEVAETEFLDYLGTLTIPPTLDVSQIIGGDQAPASGVAVSTPIPAGGAVSGAGGTGIGGLPVGGAGAAGATSNVLGGSFSTALALVSQGEPRSEGTMVQVLLAQPADTTVNLVPASASYNYDSLVGWVDASNLLIMRYDATTTDHNAALFHAPTGSESVLASGFDTTWFHTLTPDRTRVIAWPASVQVMAPFTQLPVYDAATMAQQAAYEIGVPGIGGVFLAGLTDNRAFFHTRQPSDGLVVVNLSDGLVSGPVDLLAAGDGEEFVNFAAIPPDATSLVFIGSPSAKDTQGLYSAPLQPPDFLPPLTEVAGEPRPVAMANLHNLAGVSQAERVYWNHAGTQAALVVSDPSIPSGAALFLADAAFSQATPTNAQVGLGSCVIFTPDDAWVLYVNPAGDSLLAISTAPGAMPETLVSGQTRLSLCDADWQPAGGEVAGGGGLISGGTGGTGGVTLGGGGATGGALAVGDVVTGGITDENYAVEYTIDLQAGQTITVTMQRLDGNLDSYLYIFDASGNELAHNDDADVEIGDSLFNSQIAGFTAPAAGTYTIQATRFLQESGGSSGRYELRVEVSAPVTPTPVPVTTGGGALNVGSTVTGAITTTEYAVNYTIALQAGQTITVTMQRLDGSLDTYLRILDANGIEVAFNDDAIARVGDTGLNSQIPGFTAPTAGTYTIQATRFLQEEGSSTGRYQLSVTAGAPPPTPIPPPTPTVVATAGGPLDIGATVTGEITGAAYAVNYRIMLQPTDTITVTMRRLDGNLDCYLSISDVNGNEVAFNDDATTQVGDTGLNSQIAGFTAPTAGTYTLQATRYRQEEGSSTGRYELSVTRGAGGGTGGGGGVTPSVGDVIVELTWDNAADMDVAVLAPGGQDWVYFDNPIGPNGETLTNAQGNDYCRTVGSPPREWITIPAAVAHGQWTIQAQYSLDCGTTSASYTFTVRRGETVIGTWSGVMDANNTPFRTTISLP